jgi:hypothetical protein
MNIPDIDAMRPVVNGIYMLFERHALVYVGRSTDCYKRIASHRSNGRPFDYALVTPCPDADSAWVEACLIKATEPVQNRAGLSPVPFVPAAPAPRPVIAPRVENPLAALNKSQAYERAKEFGLASQFLIAVRTGELKMMAGNGNRVRLITVGELTEWCERMQRERLSRRASA